VQNVLDDEVPQFTIATCTWLDIDPLICESVNWTCCLWCDGTEENAQLFKLISLYAR